MTGLPLSLGPWTARLDQGGLRWLRFGDIEVLRGIGPTVRDADWATILPTSIDVDATGGVRATVASSFQSRGLALAIVTTYKIRPLGLTVEFVAEVIEPTSAQRIGLSILFPLSIAGSGFIADGRRGEFPVDITGVPLASSIQQFTWDLPDGGAATIDIIGQSWDIEDQRNWSDASFKGYTPSLTEAAEATYATGHRIATRFELSVQPAVAGARGRHHVDSPALARAPAVEPPVVGCVMYGAARPDEWAHLAALGPAFVRLPVDLTSDDWPTILADGVSSAQYVGAEVVVEALSPAGAGTAAHLARALVESGSVVDVLLFDASDGRGAVRTDLVQAELLREALGNLGSRLHVGGGTRANFRELAEVGHALTGLSTVTFAICPTVHGVDDETVLENLETIPLLLRSAQELAPDAQLDVAVSLRPRINPYTREPSPQPNPYRPDPRLHGPLGEAWLAGVFASFAESPVRIHRLTLLEAFGSAGWVSASPSRTSELIASVSSPIQ